MITISDEQRVRSAVEQIVAKYTDGTTLELKRAYFILHANPKELADEMVLLIMDMLQPAGV